MPIPHARYELSFKPSASEELRTRGLFCFIYKDFRIFAFCVRRVYGKDRINVIGIDFLLMFYSACSTLCYFVHLKCS